MRALAVASLGAVSAAFGEAVAEDAGAALYNTRRELQGVAPPSPAPVASPEPTSTVPTPEQLFSAKEIGTIGTVTASAALFDTNLAANNGCDPSGCTAALTRDGDLAEGSRWSCAPKLGTTESECTISYDLGEEYGFEELRLAMYKGTERTRTVEIRVDGILVRTWTSSGATEDFEVVDLTGNDGQLIGIPQGNGVSGQKVDITGDLGQSEWLSIIETEIYVYPKNVVTPPPSVAPSPTTTATPEPTAPVATPGPPSTVPSPEQLFSAKEIGTIGTVTASAELFDTNLAASNGCDPSGCTAALTRDGDTAAGSRWSCSPKLGATGSECTITYDLGEEYAFQDLRLAMYKGTERTRTVEIRVDGTLVRTWTSSGATDDFEVVDLTGNDGALEGNLASTGVSGQTVEITGDLGQSEWLSIVETEIYVFPKDVVTPPPSPTATPEPAATPGPSVAQPSTEPPTPSPSAGSPTPSPSEGQPVVQPVTPAEDLTPVGLLPLINARGDDREKYNLKDGDLSTTWTCSGDPFESTDYYYDCNIRVNLFSYRHVKQVKIALPDGAPPIEFRITGRYNGDVGETSVTTSGGTGDLETFNFDVFADVVSIAPLFTSAGQSITISEIEVLEEVMPGEVTVTSFNTPYDNGDGRWTGPVTDGFDWSSESEEAIDRTLSFTLNSYATVDAIEIEFPVGETYKFDLQVYDDDGEPRQTFAGLESADMAGWQSFDLTGYTGSFVTQIVIVIQGTGSGAPGFKMLDARIMGTPIDNPTDTFYVGSTLLEAWDGQRYPDFIATGSGDQKAIMGAICAVKKATFNGVNCEGGDATATGTVEIPFGQWFVDGNIFMQSGVLLNGRYSIDDSPYTTDIQLEEGAAGKTSVAAIVVMDDISDARIDDLWIRGLYDPETSNSQPAVTGLGSVGLSIVGSRNITCRDTEIRFLDGDALVISDSQMVNMDAGGYDEEYLPWSIGFSRGTGIVVENSDSVWVRRHTVYENGVAGIHITGSNNFTFEATIADECFGDDCALEGEGNVGSVDGQQPIEVIVESSTLVKFEDMRVQSSNDPVMTVTGASGVSCDNCGFSNVESGTCVIKLLDADSAVTTGDDPELTLEDTPDGSCYVKV